MTFTVPLGSDKSSLPFKWSATGSELKGRGKGAYHQTLGPTFSFHELYAGYVRSLLLYRGSSRLPYGAVEVIIERDGLL